MAAAPSNDPHKWEDYDHDKNTNLTKNGAHLDVGEMVFEKRIRV